MPNVSVGWALAVALLLPSVTAVAAPEASAMSAEQVASEAAERNPQIRAARSRWEATRARIPQASSLDDPMVGADIEGIPYSSRSVANKYTDVEYMVSQTFPFPLKLFARHRAAAQEALMAEQEYQDTVRVQVAEAVVAYYDIYRLDRFIEINRRNQDLLGQFAQVAEARYASGSGGQQDALKAQTEQALLANEGITLQQERRSVVARLNALLDRTVGQDLAVPSPATPPRLSLDAEALLAVAETHNPTLRAAQARVGMAKAERSLARLGYLPDFSTRLEARQFNEQSRIREYDVMLAVNVPVWSWWKQRNAVREADAALGVVEAEVLSVRNDVAAMVLDRFARADAAQRLVDLYQMSVLPKAEQALASARAGYEGGRVEFLSLLDAQRMLHETQQATEASTAALGQEMARLEAVVGVAWSEAHGAVASAGGASAGEETVPLPGGGEQP